MLQHEEPWTMDDCHELERDGSERLTCSGTWCAGTLSGTYAASAGRRDDYLELHLTQGRFTGQHTVQPEDGWGDLSIWRFGGGRGLAILCSTPAKNPLDNAGIGDWLAHLVRRLEPVLPYLQLDQDHRAIHDAAPSSPNGHETPAVSACGGAWPEQAAGPVDPTVLLPQAVVELEHARFKAAEHLGQLAVAAGEAEATEFLESMRAIRRGAKLVRRWPRDQYARLALAQAYFLADAGAAALREATEAVRLDPLLGEGYAVIGLEYVYEGDRDRAQAAWEQAHALAPTGEWQRLLTQVLHDERWGGTAGWTQPVTGAERGWQARIRRFVSPMRRAWQHRS